jgi:hypothetical protein
MKTQQWLKFEEELPPKQSKRKTKVILVGSLKDHGYLGTISFYPGWRQYIFEGSMGDTIWSAECLRELATKIDELEAERKATIENMR